MLVCLPRLDYKLSEDGDFCHSVSYQTHCTSSRASHIVALNKYLCDTSKNKIKKKKNEEVNAGPLQGGLCSPHLPAHPQLEREPCEGGNWGQTHCGPRSTMLSSTYRSLPSHPSGLLGAHRFKALTSSRVTVCGTSFFGWHKIKECGPHTQLWFGVSQPGRSCLTYRTPHFFQVPNIVSVQAKGSKWEGTRHIQATVVWLECHN